MKIGVKLMDLGKENHNNRVYPTLDMVKAVEEYMENDGPKIGPMDSSQTVNLREVAFKIDNIFVNKENKELWAELVFLDTPYGQIYKHCWEEDILNFYPIGTGFIESVTCAISGCTNIDYVRQYQFLGIGVEMKLLHQPNQSSTY